MRIDLERRTLKVDVWIFTSSKIGNNDPTSSLTVPAIWLRTHDRDY